MIFLILLFFIFIIFFILFLYISETPIDFYFKLYKNDDVSTLFILLDLEIENFLIYIFSFKPIIKL